MAETTPLDPRPDWLIGIQAPNTRVEQLSVDGKIFPYTIVRTGLAESLPYAVGFPDERALMISEDTPIGDRRFILTHEVREKTSLAHLPAEERCPAALIAELEDVYDSNPESYDDYVLRRRDFFDALVKFYEQPKQAASVGPHFVRGIQISLEYLKGVVLTS
jgi:hypothetical protein